MSRIPPRNSSSSSVPLVAWFRGLSPRFNLQAPPCPHPPENQQDEDDDNRQNQNQNKKKTKLTAALLFKTEFVLNNESITKKGRRAKHRKNRNQEEQDYNYDEDEDDENLFDSDSDSTSSDAESILSESGAAVGSMTPSRQQAFLRDEHHPLSSAKKRKIEKKKRKQKMLKKARNAATGGEDADEDGEEGEDEKEEDKSNSNNNNQGDDIVDVGENVEMIDEQVHNSQAGGIAKRDRAKKAVKFGKEHEQQQNYQESDEGDDIDQEAVEKQRQQVAKSRGRKKGEEDEEGNNQNQNQAPLSSKAQKSNNRKKSKEEELQRLREIEQKRFEEEQKDLNRICSIVRVMYVDFRNCVMRRALVVSRCKDKTSTENTSSLKQVGDVVSYVQEKWNLSPVTLSAYTTSQDFPDGENNNYNKSSFRTNHQYQQERRFVTAKAPFGIAELNFAIGKLEDGVVTRVLSPNDSLEENGLLNVANRLEQTPHATIYIHNNRDFASWKLQQKQFISSSLSSSSSSPPTSVLVGSDDAASGTRVQNQNDKMNQEEKNNQEQENNDDDDDENEQEDETLIRHSFTFVVPLVALDTTKHYQQAPTAVASPCPDSPFPVAEDQQQREEQSSSSNKASQREKDEMAIDVDADQITQQQQIRKHKQLQKQLMLQQEHQQEAQQLPQRQEHHNLVAIKKQQTHACLALGCPPVIATTNEEAIELISCPLVPYDVAVKVKLQSREEKEEREHSHASRLKERFASCFLVPTCVLPAAGSSASATCAASPSSPSSASSSSSSSSSVLSGSRFVLTDEEPIQLLEKLNYYEDEDDDEYYDENDEEGQEEDSFVRDEYGNISPQIAREHQQQEQQQEDPFTFSAVCRRNKRIKLAQETFQRRSQRSCIYKAILLPSLAPGNLVRWWLRKNSISQTSLEQHGGKPARSIICRITAIHFPAAASPLSCSSSSSSASATAHLLNPHLSNPMPPQHTADLEACGFVTPRFSLEEIVSGRAWRGVCIWPVDLERLD